MYVDVVVQEDIPKISQPFKQSIKKAIEERLTVDPISFGKPLQFSLKGFRRLRVGNYRIVYRVDDEQKIVIVVIIDHRKIVYEKVFIRMA